ncbi:MAG: YtxH domain-containing protein [Candidatus Margulisbacteria bacterium]|jgi:gas vesicle protein|nr:YtxH domain-containing protein [Candidatus Margulisiibacteriota bacterium]
MGKLGNFVKTLTVGGALGFVAGLLFAPQKGEDSRKQLQDAVEKGKVKFTELKDKMGGSCCGGDPDCCKD